MPTTRKIQKVIKSKPTLEGAGVHLRRAFGFGATELFDPFLLMDDFRGEQPSDYIKGFPWHPHRGIETITYVTAGQVEHGDSMGNKGVIGPGDVQWMTAGSGIIHQEMPKAPPDGRMYGFQLWANLPRTQKMMDPRYRDVKSNEIPVVSLENGVSIKVVSGTVNGVRGPVQDIVIEPEYLDIILPANTSYTHPTQPGHTVFAYVFEGKARFCVEQDAFDYDEEGNNYFDMQRDPYLENHSLVVFDDGDQVQITTADEPVRFLLISGKPLREPVAWYGPIVMNTEEELRVAFREYQDGTFIKKK
jgi:quercetin 2,3-dioxygenase